MIQSESSSHELTFLLTCIHKKIKNPCLFFTTTGQRRNFPCSFNIVLKSYNVLLTGNDLTFNS